jgi:hypothetical protein
MVHDVKVLSVEEHLPPVIGEVVVIGRTQIQLRSGGIRRGRNVRLPRPE